jgi:four helix bundle protein
MTHQELYRRIYDLSVRVEQFAAPLFDRPATATIADQLTRAARGAAANYQASNHGRSNADFRSKLTLALEEADETQHWLQHLSETGLAAGPTLAGLLKESREISKILGASVRTANRNARARGETRGKSRSKRRRSAKRPRPPVPRPDRSDDAI